MTEAELERIRDVIELAAVGHMTTSQEGQVALQARKAINFALRAHAALTTIRAHHHAINRKLGRPYEDSQTLRLVQHGLGADTP